MKRSKLAITSSAGVILLSSVDPAMALLPEPGNIYFGTARDVFGRPYSPEESAVVSMVRVIGMLDNPFDEVPDDDIVLAESPILAPVASSASTVNFILRPSLDGFGGSRYAATAGRENDAVRIFITANGIRYDVASAADCAPISDPVLPLGARATVRELNIRAIDDIDLDCIADSWEVFFFGDTGFGALEDFDGDGYSNVQEFLGGTSPLQPDRLDTTLENLGLTIATGQGSTVTVDWPRDPSRSYVLEWSSDASAGYTAIPAARLSGIRSNVVDVTGFTRVFIRLRVTR
jgi:hypothetical protein